MSPMTGPMLKVGKELTQAKFDADFYSDLRDPKTYLEVKTVEKTTFDGRPCYKVSLKRIDGVAGLRLLRRRHRPARRQHQHPRDARWASITMTSIEGDYKKIGKLMQAMSVTQQVMGIEQKITLTMVEYDNVARLGVRAAGRRSRPSSSETRPRRRVGRCSLACCSPSCCRHARGLDRDLQGGGDVRRGLEDRQGQPLRSRVRRGEMGSRRGRAPAEGRRGEDPGRVPRGARRHARPPRPLALRRHSLDARQPGRPRQPERPARVRRPADRSATRRLLRRSRRRRRRRRRSPGMDRAEHRRRRRCPTLLAGIPEATPPRLAQLQAWRLAVHAAARPVRIRARRSVSSTAPARPSRRASNASTSAGEPVTVGSLPTMFVRVSSSLKPTPAGKHGRRHRVQRVDDGGRSASSRRRWIASVRPTAS